MPQLIFLCRQKEFAIPQDFIDRLSHSEINSISDLQRLLEVNSPGPGNEVIEEVKQKHHQKSHHSFKAASSDLKSLQLSHRRKRSVGKTCCSKTCHSS
ncbi:hypothetical protein cypCar_00016894 [Cyprinus carpio]|nr:hypothetical protein cypCar_00016894 [Cyprinus carpio]